MAKREVMVSHRTLDIRDGRGANVVPNVGDKVQLVETERGLRSINPHDRNAKLVNATVVSVREQTGRDRRTGRLTTEYIATARED